MITNHQDGILVPPGDVEKLAQQIIYLIEHEDERRKMGENALINVQRYSIEHIASEWNNLFQKLLLSKKK
jgi:glycosyltransferase involved in cell wall biosynthesis